MSGLSAYLLIVRVKFPRFFMLSNDDLLIILADTKHIVNIQPHLKKVFDNLNLLKFTDEQYDEIEGMIS
jgi:dynein heavy chain